MHHTKRGGKQTPYYPRGLPEADSLPPLTELLDPTCKSKSPSQGKFAAVDNIHLGGTRCRLSKGMVSIKVEGRGAPIKALTHPLGAQLRVDLSIAF